MAFSAAALTMVSWMLLRVMTAPMGTAALFMALATLIMSGLTPKKSAAKGVPRRPKPVMTSSKISRTPCLSQMERRRWR